MSLRLDKVINKDEHRVLLFGLQCNLEPSVLWHFDNCATNQNFVIFDELTFGGLHVLRMSLSHCDEYDTMRPAALEFGIIAGDGELLESVEVANDVSFIGLGMVVPGPVLRVDGVVCVVDEIVNEDVPIVCIKENLDGLTLLPGEVVEVVIFAELIDFEGTPD